MSKISEHRGRLPEFDVHREKSRAAGVSQRLAEFLRLKCGDRNDSRSYRTESTCKLLGRNDLKGIEDEPYSAEHEKGYERAEMPR